MEARPDFSQILAESSSILILLGENPDFDKIAAALSLYLSVRSLGKNVSISSPSQMVVASNRLVGIDKISQELGGKNLRIAFRDYQAEGIERVSYDVEGGQFFLTVIPKTGAPSPKPEQVDISFTGVGGVDALFLIGVKGLSELGGLNKPELLSIPRVLVVGIERPGLDIAQVRPTEVIDLLSESLSEVVGNLILSNNLPLDEDIAANLFQGLVKTTANFTSSKVRAETFQIAAELVRAGAKKAAISTPSRSPVSIEQPGLASETPEESHQDWFGPPRVFTGGKGTSIS